MVLVFRTNDLPANSEEAFATFEERARQAYEEQLQIDRNRNSDQNGSYEGSYEPERSYVSAILAFLDEHSISSNVEDISELDNVEFFKEFGRFKSRVEYISHRFRLRKERLASGAIGTAITIEVSYKIEAGELLSKIRKIINLQVEAGPKKDKIFQKIADLQSEIDRDLTTIDAMFGRMLDLSRIIGECGDGVKPAVDQLERIKEILWGKSKKVDSLPKPDRQKSLPKPTEKQIQIDDDIPF